jgi:hypothetical protein
MDAPPGQLQHAAHLDVGMSERNSGAKPVKRLSRSGIVRNFVEQFQVAGGLGFEPRLTESEDNRSLAHPIAFVDTS